MDIDVYVDVALVWASCSRVLLLVDADVLTSAASAIPIFLCDADVFAVAVVSTGRALRSVVSIFPSSALDRNSLVNLDFSGGSLLVPVSGGEDAERDSGRW